MASKDHWYTSRKDIETVYTALRAIAKDHGARVSFRRLNKQVEAQVEFGDDSIEVSSQLSVQQTLSAFFHELAHLTYKYQGKFFFFHSHDVLQMEPHERPPQYFSTAFRAEVFTDNLGTKLQDAYFPGIPYCRSYSWGDEDTKQWLEEWVGHPRALKRKQKALKKRKK